jgi:hypothetical protein
MNDARLVGGSERVGDLNSDLNCLVERDRATR